MGQHAGRTDAVAGSLGTLLDAGAVASLSDRQLVERFVAGRLDSSTSAEAAFAALVARHGGMVLGVARRILRDDAGADDAFQATWLVLARRAGSVRVGESLGPWLHGVARRVAARARRQRQGQAARGAGGSSDPDTVGFVSPDAALRAELRGVLDQEIGRLPGHLRESVVLCLLEGQSLSAAASQMGCAVGTAGSRLSRARGLLRSRLHRRGFVPSLALLEPADLAATVPPALVRATTLMTLANRLAAVPTPVAALARLTLRDLLMTRTLALTLLAVGTLMLGGSLTEAVRSAQPPPAAPVARLLAAPRPPDDPPATPERTLRILVLGPDGQPVPHAQIHQRTETVADHRPDEPRSDSADASGLARLTLPAGTNYVRVWVRAPGLVGLTAAWGADNFPLRGQDPDPTTPIPTDYTFHFEQATTAGGQVVDEAGQPVAGARVRMGASLFTKDVPKPPGGDAALSYDSTLTGPTDPPIVTDADGRWEVRTVPPPPEVPIWVSMDHPDFVARQYWGGDENDGGVSSAELRRATARIILRKGVVATGRVLDPAGQAVRAGVVVVVDPLHPFENAEAAQAFAIGPDGTYRLPPLLPGAKTLTAVVPGLAPQERQVDLQPNGPAQDFRLEPGQTVRLKVVDAAGRPIAAAGVEITGWLGAADRFGVHAPPATLTKIPAQTDANGVWEWTGAPATLVRLRVERPGSLFQVVKVTAGAPEATVTLVPEHRVTGRVVDAATGAPVLAFTVVPQHVIRASGRVYSFAQRDDSQPGQGGRIDFLVEQPIFDAPPTPGGDRLQLRIEAPGYRMALGPDFLVGDDAARVQDFRLTPAPPITGTVVDAAGQPVAGAWVTFGTPADDAQLSDPEQSLAHTRTDAAGRFAFLDPGDRWGLIAWNETGIVTCERPLGTSDAGTLRLQPWALLRGRLVDGGQPVANAEIHTWPIRIYDRGRSAVDTSWRAVTEADGQFALWVAPGSGHVSVFNTSGQTKLRSRPSAPFALQPGQEATIDLGVSGVNLASRVELTGAIPAGLDWASSSGYLIRREAGSSAPPLAGLAFDARRGWQDAWTMTPEGQAYRSTLHFWEVEFAPDGSFQASGVPAGDYDLALTLDPHRERVPVAPLGRATAHLTVTEAQATAGGTLTLPPLPATVRPIPPVGATPALTFERPDGSVASLADQRGHPVLVRFGVTWSLATRDQTPALRQIHDRFGPSGLTVLDLALDDDAAAWRLASREAGRPGLPGRLPTPDAAGVVTLPTCWLLDPAGKIVAEAADPAELADPIAAILVKSPSSP